MKTEKEKMLAGEVYDSGDKEIVAQWHLAKTLMYEFNNTPNTDKQKQDEILYKLLGSRGENLWIAAPFLCDFGENIHIGNNTEINLNCTFLDCNKITIGSNVLIAPNVQLYTASHPIKASDRIPQGDVGGNNFAFCKTTTAPITIGDNVWIGGGVIILPGVTIGNNTTIGAGSVVTKSIPSDVLAYGNPCRVIKKL